jgi:formate/nitrite transporter FocA (FNT family)|nr:MAG TPA: hypothetical protein [Caudoviricetes sp.]
MWIYILVGVICNLIGALIMWFMMKPHEEGAIIIENGNAYLQLNHEPEKLAEHQFVTFMVISRK